MSNRHIVVDLDVDLHVDLNVDLVMEEIPKDNKQKWDDIDVERAEPAKTTTIFKSLHAAVFNKRKCG